MCNCLFTNNLIQLLSEPTHVRGNILDLCITNTPYCLSNLAVDQSSCSSQSDHHLLTLNILSKSTHKQITESPLRKLLLNYSKADIPSIEEYLLNSSIVESIPHIKDVNTVWLLIKREILNACYKFTPTVKIRTNPSPKWFDSRIRHQINRIRTLRHRTTKTHHQGICLVFVKWNWNYDLPFNQPNQILSHKSCQLFMNNRENYSAISKI